MTYISIPLDCLLIPFAMLSADTDKEGSTLPCPPQSLSTYNHNTPPSF